MTGCTINALSIICNDMSNNTMDSSTIYGSTLSFGSMIGSTTTQTGATLQLYLSTIINGTGYRIPLYQ
jgi:hypothetical protein